MTITRIYGKCMTLRKEFLVSYTYFLSHPMINFLKQGKQTSMAGWG